MAYSIRLLAAALIVGAYLLGAIPFGLIVARSFAGVDVRATGSGNIGAANVARSTSKALGALTLLLDAIKGALPVLVAQYAFRASLALVAGVGVATVVGHCLPIYLKFRGGKGVATGLGVFMALTPGSTLIALLTFAVIYLATHIVSIGSLVAALVLLAGVVVLDGRTEVIFAASVVVTLVLVRHASNIARMAQRREHRV